MAKIKIDKGVMPSGTNEKRDTSQWGASGVNVNIDCGFTPSVVLVYADSTYQYSDLSVAYVNGKCFLDSYIWNGGKYADNYIVIETNSNGFSVRQNSASGMEGQPFNYIAIE